MGSEREEHYFVMVREKSMSQIKSDLIHAFLCVSIRIRHLTVLIPLPKPTVDGIEVYIQIMRRTSHDVVHYHRTLKVYVLGSIMVCIFYYFSNISYIIVYIVK